jgi:hypothetical protein
VDSLSSPCRVRTLVFRSELGQLGLAIMAIAITDTVIIRSTISTTTDPTMARHLTGITGSESITTTTIIITTTIKLR